MTNTLTVGCSTPCYGFLILTTNSGGDSTISIPASTAAYFTNTATKNINPSSFVKVTNASLNGDIFKFYTYDYSDSINLYTHGPTYWSVTGLGTIPTFSYFDNDASPKYTGFYSLPDSIHKNQNLVIPLTGLSGTDTALITLTDGTHSVTKSFIGTSTSVTFSSTNLSPFNVVTNGQLSVLCTKNNIQTFGGKNFNFATCAYFYKTISIK